MQFEQKPVNTRDGDDDAAILEEARERAQYAYEYWFDQHQEWKEDVHFLGGAQWDQQEAEKRREERRPMLTINTLPQYVDQVMGDILQNRPAIHVAPSDSSGSSVKIASLDTKSNYSLAQLYEGLIRDIEYSSGAESHYDTAAQHAIEAGMGWLRVYTRYCEGPTMDQELAIGAVRNRWSVLVDPDAKEPDMSDAGYGFVLEDMPRLEFRKRYPDAGDQAIVDTSTGERRFIWSTEQKVRVAEYFTREAVKREIVQLTSGEVKWLDELHNVEKDGEKISILDDLAANGITIHSSRKVDTYKVHWRLINGIAVLEKKREWPGSTIPIVPVSGKRLDLEDGSLYRGLIHHSKDAKRADNYYMSASVERIGASPKAPWVLYADEIEGHEAMWNQANVEARPYLVVNRGPDGSRPQRTAPAPMPAAELQMSAIMTDKVKSTIGMYDASVGNRSNETSGKAILARQRESDTGSFAYTDNLKKAIRRVGIICTEVIPKIYDGTRVLRLRDRNGEADFVKMNETVIDQKTGTPIIVNDIRAGKMDVRVLAGPSYATQRAEAAEAMLEFVRVVPAAGQVILDKIASNMDWPGADEIARRLVKLVPPNFLTEREKADNEVTPPEPTPAERAELAKHEATIALAQSKTAEAEARMAELNAAAEGGDNIDRKIRDIVAEAMAEVLAVANQQTPPPAKPNGAAKPKPAA